MRVCGPGKVLFIVGNETAFGPYMEPHSWAYLSLGPLLKLNCCHDFTPFRFSACFVLIHTRIAGSQHTRSWTILCHYIYYLDLASICLDFGPLHVLTACLYWVGILFYTNHFGLLHVAA